MDKEGCARLSVRNTQVSSEVRGSLGSWSRCCSEGQADNVEPQNEE
jgi:hypothetical protein